MFSLHNTGASICDESIQSLFLQYLFSSSKLFSLLILYIVIYRFKYKCSRGFWNFGRRNILFMFIASRWGLEFLKVSCHSSIYDESFLSLFVQYLFQDYLDFAAIDGPFLAPTKRIICEIRAACPTFIDANLIIVTDVGFFFLSVLNYSQRIVRNLFISLSPPRLFPDPRLVTCVQ